MSRKFSSAMVLLLLLLVPALGFGNEKLNLQPKACLPESVFTFQPVVEGNQVVHEFIIRNQGEASLNILDLKSG